MDIKIKTCFAVFLAFALSLTIVLGDADFQVTSFSCSPSEVAINSVFSCTAQIKNSGTAGTLNAITLFPDSSAWLQEGNYAQIYGSSVGEGQSVSITFTGLKAIKSGNNGFSKITLDPVTDYYVVNNNKRVNIIDVVVTISNSVSSAAMGASFDSTAEVTAGGNIDVILTFTVNSGGCSIGSQPTQKTITGMGNQDKQSRVWSVTQGTSGNCRYTISASATGTGGVATKIDSTPSTVTCTNCPSGGDGGTTGGGGGGGGGGGATKIYILGELTSAQTVELVDGEKAEFNISSVGHTLTLKNHTETTAIITIQSSLQTFTLQVGEEEKVDLNSDGISEISVKLKSINILTGKVMLILAPISEIVPTEGGITGEAVGEEEGPVTTTIKKNKILIAVIIIFIVLAVLSAYYLIKKRNKY